LNARRACGTRETNQGGIGIPVSPFHLSIIRHARYLSFVMPALVAGIHVFLDVASENTWMAGTKPGHDEERKICRKKS
jgi:hypothetical protein